MLRLREIRERRGKTQQEMANFLKITRPAYTQYESGRREPDFNTISRLADFFGVTTDYLLGRDGQKKIGPSSDGPIPDALLKNVGLWENYKNLFEYIPSLKTLLDASLTNEERKKRSLEILTSLDPENLKDTSTSIDVLVEIILANDEKRKKAFDILMNLNPENYEKAMDHLQYLIDRQNESQGK